MITQEYLDSLDKRTNEYKKAKKEFDAQGKKMSDKHRTTEYYKNVDNKKDEKPSYEEVEKQELDEYLNEKIDDGWGEEVCDENAKEKTEKALKLRAEEIDGLKEMEKWENKHRTTQYYTQEELNEKYEANKGKGLGDVVESITKATGIDKLVKFVAGEDCGCDERKKKLNNLRFRKQPLCLNEEEYNFLHKLYNKGSKTIGHTEKETLIKIEERIFQKKYVESLNCAPCIIQVYKDLKEIYDVYN